MSPHDGLLYCGQDFFATFDSWETYFDDKRRTVVSVVYTGLAPCAGNHHLKTLVGRVALGAVVQVRHLDGGRIDAVFLSEDGLI